jgi:hypothetical protein
MMVCLEIGEIESTSASGPLPTVLSGRIFGNLQPRDCACPEDHHALQRVLQLPDVAGPVVVGEGFEQRWIDSRGSSRFLRQISSEEGDAGILARREVICRRRLISFTPALGSRDSGGHNASPTSSGCRLH